MCSRMSSQHGKGPSVENFLRALLPKAWHYHPPGPANSSLHESAGTSLPTQVLRHRRGDAGGGTWGEYIGRRL